MDKPLRPIVQFLKKAKHPADSISINKAKFYKEKGMERYMLIC